MPPNFVSVYFMFYSVIFTHSQFLLFFHLINIGFPGKFYIRIIEILKLNQTIAEKQLFKNKNF